MATIVDSLRRSSININTISKSLNETKKSVSSVNDSVNNISKIIATNTRVKRELFDSSRIINIRREEASRRQQIEDQLESSKVSSSPVRGLAFAGRSEKGPLGRLLGFLGFITAGWIVENLPTWIFMGKEFISRIQTFGRSMYNMVDDMKSIIISFGSVLKNSFNAIITLNFDEFSEGSVAQSFDELNLAVQSLGDDITKTFELFTTPLNKSVETGQEAPGLGEDRPETMFAEGGIEGLSKLIAKAETGGRYTAYAGDRGKGSPDITSMTLTQLRQKYGDYNTAVGAYQFMPGTAIGLTKQMGLDPNKTVFTPEFQDRLNKFHLMKMGYADFKSGKISQKEYGARIAQQYRALPDPRTGSTYADQYSKYNRATISLDEFNLALKRSKEQTATSNITQSVPVGKINPRVGDRLGAGRNHGGVDLQVKEGTPLRAISDGVIVDSDYEKGWGNFLVMKDNLGIYHLYGHMQSGYKRGGPVKKGEVIGKVGMTGRTTGPHLHWETGTGWNGGVITGRFDALTKYSKFAPFNTQPGKDVKTETLTQISAPPSRMVQVAAMTPQRKGSSIVIIDDTKPQQPQVSYPSQQPVSTPTIHESKLLNNFIKNKLLLDLAYL